MASIVDIGIGAVISIASTVSVQTYLYNRNVKINSKNTVRNIFNLLTESVDNVGRQLAAYQEQIIKITDHDDTFPQLTIVPYKSWELLRDELFKESSFLSFEKTFSNRTDLGDSFFKMRKNSASIVVILDDMVKFLERVRQKHAERISTIESITVNVYAEVRKLRMSAAHLKTQDVTSLLLKRINQDDLNSIRSRHDDLFKPAYKAMRELKAFPDELFDLYNLVRTLIAENRRFFAMRETYKRIILARIGNVAPKNQELSNVSSYLRDRMTEKYF